MHDYFVKEKYSKTLSSFSCKPPTTAYSTDKTMGETPVTLSTSGTPSTSSQKARPLPPSKPTRTFSGVGTPMSAPAPFSWPPSMLPRSNRASDGQHQKTIVEEESERTNPGKEDEEDEIDYLRLILNARVYDVANETPLQYAPKVDD